MKKYLIALPTLRHLRGFNCPTILIKAKDEAEAKAIALYVSGAQFLGDIKEVNY